MTKLKHACVKCFKCNQKVEADKFNSKFPDSIGIVYGATFWRSCGNYGSTIYDPMSGTEYLEIIICDECLKGAAQKKQVTQVVFKTVKKIVSNGKFEVDRSKEDKARKQIREEGTFPVSYVGDGHRMKRGYHKINKIVSKPKGRKE